MNKALLKIVSETPRDQYDVNQIAKMAFGQVKECMLIERLRVGQSFVPELSLIAKYKEINIGHVLLTRVEIGGDNNFLAMAPLAVHPSFQKMGVGSELVNTSLELAEKLGFSGVVVLGHASYYPQFGFEKASKYNVICPYDVVDETFMIKPFVDMSHIEGMVIYPDAFLED